jgi:hypothetical protein
MDAEGIPDDALVEDRHSFETRALVGLFVRVQAVREDEPT